ncbi:peptidylprolyl isomerase [Mycolicibacterium nivoides]|uniref:peptidylprolyl isomerase n=1 Tax=Mycolicibacterium nivoides TaxID=2487344 RepID=UPI0008CC5009|nr:peptidylprolyl isomerase [Mycolicibacterium nivoides]QRY43871.1 peptidylprolyl isomerase [Mycolicibacterium boenickei]SEQ32853.1 peptidyl-prolyl cis-trans isomerase B (cyclophilin B) [Mycobacterium sp. 88mf]SFF44971.1 peptidyl-prolyl cis-trans isomerase B (cyclophilin B) [Mycobacterium sp. 455mf]
MTAPPPYGGYQPDDRGYAPGYPVGYPAGYPPSAHTNGMAVAALVCAVLFAPLGIVFGHISLSQLKRSGEQGRGIAIAGLVIGYVMTALAIVAVVLAVVFAFIVVKAAEDMPRRERYTASPGSEQQLPAFAAPANLGANCQYPATTEPATKPARPPRTGTVPTEPATVEAGIVTDHGSIGLNLANGKAPCTVNNFASLASQGFFDGTQCHRLTTGDLAALQCGDPSGSGTGGPGYRFPNEYPTNQYRLADPALRQPVVYPRGTVAMANSGPGTNGSQFFLVYEDSLLPPTYTVFGTVDNTGLATLDAIADGGVADGSDDGKPATPVTIKSASLG